MRTVGLFLVLLFLVAATQAGPGKSRSHLCAPPAEAGSTMEDDSEKSHDWQHGSSAAPAGERPHLRSDFGADRVTLRARRRAWGSTVSSSRPCLLRC